MGAQYANMPDGFMDHVEPHPHLHMYLFPHLLAPQVRSEPAAEFIEYMDSSMTAYNLLNIDEKLEEIRVRSINLINMRQFQQVHVLADEGDRLMRMM